MKLLRLLSLLCLAAIPVRAGDPPKKLVACIEPAVMRTEAARLLPGSKRTVIVPAREEEYGLSRLSKDEFTATGLKWEQFLTEAATGAAAHLNTLKPEIRKDAKGNAEYAILKSESHLTASVVLCPEFFTQFKETFGDRLVVLMPDRFTVYVFPRSFSGFQTMGPAILESHARSVYPCSQEAFEVTADGLKGLGAYNAEGGAAPAKAPAEASGKPAPANSAPAAKKAKKS